MSEQDSFQIFKNFANIPKAQFFSKNPLVERSRTKFNVQRSNDKGSNRQRLKFKDSKFKEIPQKLIKFFAASFVL